MKSRCLNSRLFLFLLISIVSVGFRAFAVSPRVAYDMDMACEICAALPLETVEGVWLYPEDNVTVLILKNQNPVAANVYSTYTISVVETSDARLHPGDILGQLSATPESGVYKIELATEKKNDLLLKPKTCMANLGKDGDTFIFKKRNSNLKTRLNLNLNRLLPGFWKIVGIGLSSNSGNSAAAPVGMIKVYPSYDGNGSSRRETRYL
ncbi:MAG: hypothetical protein J1E82_07395 [Muribaculaceae bacterium]|nr:hypothetical protein [Muribaculaceae bacterium]